MNEKKKLLIFPNYFIPHVGGVETHVDEFSKYLSKKNYEITIFAPAIPKTKKTIEKRHNNVTIIRYPAFDIVPNYPFPKLWDIKTLKLTKQIYKNDYDIVMSRTRFFLSSAFALFYSKFRFKKKPFIHVEHGSCFVELESKFKTKIAYLYDIIIGKTIFFFSDKNIAISMAVKNFMTKDFKLKSKNIPIIRRGVDFEIYENLDESKEIKNRFKNKTIICFLGRLYKWKGVKNTIEAYKMMPKETQKKSVLIIVGYGEDEELLKKCAGKYKDNGIYFLGKRSFEDSITILKASDIYAHSAYPGGGLSNSLLQAMYCKCTVVASPHEGAKEVVINNQNGILLKNNSPKMISEGIQKLINEKRHINLYSKKAHKDIKENFSWGKVTEEYIKIFNDIEKKYKKRYNIKS